MSERAETNAAGAASSQRREGCVNWFALIIALLVGGWVCLQIMNSGVESIQRPVRCGEQLMTVATNPFQRISVISPESGSSQIETYFFHKEPRALYVDSEDAEELPDIAHLTEETKNSDDDEDIENDEFDEYEDSGFVVVEGLSVTKATDLPVGYFSMQHVCVRRGTKLTYKVVSALKEQKISIFIFDYVKHFGDFVDPKHNFTEARGALLRKVVLTGESGVFTVDDSLFEGSNGNFIDLCIAARNNVAQKTAKDGTLIGGFINSVRLIVRVGFVRSDLTESVAQCADSECEYSALNAPDGSVFALTQLKGRCAPRKSTVVTVSVWYAWYVYCVSFSATFAFTYAMLAFVLPSMLHLVEKKAASEPTTPSSSSSSSSKSKVN